MTTIAFAIVIGSLHLAQWKDNSTGPLIFVTIVYLVSWIGFIVSVILNHAS